MSLTANSKGCWYWLLHNGLFCVKPCNHTMVAFMTDSYPEYVPDHFRTLINSSLIIIFLFPNFTKNSPIYFSSYPANKQTDKHGWKHYPAKLWQSYRNKLADKTRNIHLKWIVRWFGVQLITCKLFADETLCIVQRIGWIVIWLQHSLVTNQDSVSTKHTNVPGIYLLACLVPRNLQYISSVTRENYGRTTNYRCSFLLSYVTLDQIPKTDSLLITGAHFFWYWSTIPNVRYSDGLQFQGLLFWRSGSELGLGLSLWLLGIGLVWLWFRVSTARATVRVSGHSE